MEGMENCFLFGRMDRSSNVFVGLEKRRMERLKIEMERPSFKPLEGLILRPHAGYVGFAIAIHPFPFALSLGFVSLDRVKIRLKPSTKMGSRLLLWNVWFGKVSVWKPNPDGLKAMYGVYRFGPVLFFPPFALLVSLAFLQGTEKP